MSVVIKSLNNAENEQKTFRKQVSLKDHKIKNA